MPLHPSLYSCYGMLFIPRCSILLKEDLSNISDSLFIMELVVGREGSGGLKDV